MSASINWSGPPPWMIVERHVGTGPDDVDVWIRDAVALLRIGPGDERDEMGVPVWMSDRKRYSSADAWRLHP